MEKQKSIPVLLKDIGEKAAKYRYDNRMTLDELAGIAKVSTVLLSQIEKNALKNLSLNKLVGVCKAIGCKLDIVLTPIEK